MSIGLKPVIRRVWALKGHCPVIRVQQRYEWLYVYGFLCPETGESFWLLQPSVNIEIFGLALAHFAQALGAGPDRRIVLVLDRAGWHKSGDVIVPEGIPFIFLPPYSPELQPCERLWPLANEAIANQHFQTLDELQEAQVRRSFRSFLHGILIPNPLIHEKVQDQSLAPKIGGTRE